MKYVVWIYALGLAAGLGLANAGSLPEVVQAVHDLPYCDKLLHFLMFGLLALAANLALASSRGQISPRAIALVGAVVLLVATVEETSNQFVPRRDFSLGDLAANYAGIVALGVLPFFLSLQADRQRESDADPAVGHDASPPHASDPVV